MSWKYQSPPVEYKNKKRCAAIWQVGYNEGYEKLGEPQFKKYVLEYMPGPTGGHCVNPNHKILEDHGISIRTHTS